ncbi:MAG: phosphoribosylanthranilate isomerase [Endomicrobium sp.]|jgi:phosphoribosylanthranilate isomerase|nr:phosphoribosylanthranilate isomerase [Endomicrobium sp.]
MAKVKICGLANYNDALNATNLDADFVGFHFIKESSCKVSEKLAFDVISKLPPFVTPVAVFCNEDEKVLAKVIKKLNIKNTQFNGSEPLEYCKTVKHSQNVKIFKFFKVTSNEDILQVESYKDVIDYLILDVAYKDGEQTKFNYDIVLKIQDLKIPVFISGDIVGDDVKGFLDKASPYGFEANESVEGLPKRKDYDKMSSFIKAAHGLRI